MQTLTNENFKDYTKEGVSVVFFTSPWCGPCRVLKTTFPVLEEKAQAKLAMVDISQSLELAEEHKVTNTPTIIFFKDGVEVFRKNTVMRVEEVLEELSKINA